MRGGDTCLLDSNIRLRIRKSDDPQHAVISHQKLEIPPDSREVHDRWRSPACHA
jgi:hypothetical protein